MFLMLISGAYAWSVAETPNILLLIVDDVGPDKIGIYAADESTYTPTALPQTETIDSLAAAGLRFTQAWANPLCSPTRAGLHTGNHAFRHGIGRPLPMAPELDPAYITLPELASATHATALFGKWHLGYSGESTDALPTPDWTFTARQAGYTPRWVPTTANPLRHGYQHFDGNLDGEVVDYWRWFEILADINQLNPSTGQPEAVAWTESTYATSTTVARATHWIQEQTGPWMATVALHAGHSDKSGWDARHTTESCAGVAPDPVATTLVAYQAMVQCMDDAIADLLAGIGDEELARTLIIFMGDNGTEAQLLESVYAHTDSGGHADRGKGSTYETGVRVPLILTDGESWMAYRDMGVLVHGWVRWPGRVAPHPVHTTDLFATLGEVIGADVSTGVDSVSMAPYLDAPHAAWQRDHVYTETFRDLGGGLIAGTAAYREQDLKLVIKVSLDGSGAPCRNIEMYDLSADPFEQVDLASDAAYADVLTKMLRRLTRVDNGALPTWVETAIHTPCAGG